MEPSTVTPNATMDNYLAKLFPIPSSQPPSPLSPRLWPGSTVESTAAMREVMQDNHKRWHVFFDEVGRHNHTTHHLLALWTLGADANVIKAAYEWNCTYQQPAFKSPEPINESNFVEHLGDHRYFNAYLHFFSKALQEHTVSETLEKYLFSKEMNFDSTMEGTGKHQPEMLGRFLDAIVHPLIHIGYGLELNIPGMVIEGLASAAVHRASSTAIITPELFDTLPEITHIDGQFMQRLVLHDTKPSPPRQENVHALDIMARMLKDDRLANFKPSAPLMTYNETMAAHGQTIKSYADQWTLDTKDPQMVAKKFEELVWVNTIIYGISFWKGGQTLAADFFYMHLVTSSLFLPTVLAYLSTRSQVLLLRTYFMVCLGWWIGHGRQPLDIRGFFSEDSVHPSPPGPQPKPLEGTLPSPSSRSTITPNPWLPIIQSSIVHIDEHLPKLMRALAHYSVLYGNRVAGDLANTELDGAERLDGSLFIRIAGMTAKWMGRTREGERPALYKEGVPYRVALFWAGLPGGMESEM